MPKLPVIKAKDLLRVLLKIGFVKHHQAGSHIQLKHVDGRRTTIPYHPSQEIRRGTLRGLIDDLQMTADAFIELIQRKK